MTNLQQIMKMTSRLGAILFFKPKRKDAKAQSTLGRDPDVR